MMGNPLDNQKAVFYGQFVLAAYTMFEAKNVDPLRPEPVGIPAGWEVGAWIHMSDFVLNDETMKFYGIVVHSLEDPSSRIIAIRGTEGAVEWLDDAACILVPFRQVPSAGRVSFGFDKIYSTMKVVKRPIVAVDAAAEAAVPETYSGSFAEQLEQLAIHREAARGLAKSEVAGKRPRRPTVVTAHSLGGALATLFAMENDDKGKFDLSALCTFASPRVGNLEFIHLFNQLPIDSWRIANQRDLVTKVPPHIPVLLDYEHVDVGYLFDSATFAKKSLTCYHSMETYLHWLDPTVKLATECVPPAG
jgi:triacylglycerol lipase